MTTKKLMYAVAIAALMASSVQAAVISIRPLAVAILDENFTPVDPSLIVSHDPSVGAVLNASPGKKYQIQVDVLMNASDLQAAQIGFGNAAFNINLTGATQSAILPGWQADATQVDSNGVLPGGIVPKWADNGDFGPDGTDLQSIIIGTAPRGFSAATGANSDPRRTLGVEPYNNPVGSNANGDYAGSIYLELSGEAGSHATLDLLATGGSIYLANGDLSTDGTTASGGSLNFQVVPEPSTLALLGLGSALLVFARKRR